MVKKALNVPRLELHLYAEDEYERRKEILDRMAADGIGLFPSEEPVER